LFLDRFDELFIAVLLPLKYQRRRAAYEDVLWADRELARRRQD